MSGGLNVQLLKVNFQGTNEILNIIDEKKRKN
jgi:hypothetical protein